MTSGHVDKPMPNTPFPHKPVPLSLPPFAHKTFKKKALNPTLPASKSQKSIKPTFRLLAKVGAYNGYYQNTLEKRAKIGLFASALIRILHTCHLPDHH